MTYGGRRPPTRVRRRRTSGYGVHLAGEIGDGPFAGVPFLLKDLDVQMKGTVCTNGSGVWRDAVADHDSTLPRARAATCRISNAPNCFMTPFREN